MSEVRFPYPEEVRTHWDGCWDTPHHHNCAVAKIAALAKRVEELEGILHPDKGGRLECPICNGKVYEDSCLHELTVDYKDLKAENERLREALGEVGQRVLSLLQKRQALKETSDE